jgi:hypothetical protein
MRHHPGAHFFEVCAEIDLRDIMTPWRAPRLSRSRTPDASPKRVKHEGETRSLEQRVKHDPNEIAMASRV